MATNSQKEQYYNNLHAELADRYSISPLIVKTIRSLHLGYQKPRKDIALWAAYNLTLPLDKRKRNKAYYQTILNVAAGFYESDWKLLVKPYKYDRENARLQQRGS